MTLFPLKSAFSVLLLGLTLPPLNLAQLASVAVLPFSGRFFRRINRACAGLWWRFCVFCLEKPLQVKIAVTGDALPAGGENALLFANHQGATDPLALLPLAWRAGRLSSLKWFAKEPLKYVPFVGWGMLFLDCVFLRRSWAEDRAGIERAFARLLAHPEPFWLVTFSEGTRRTPAKLARNQEYARGRGLVPFRHVLLPRSKGFVAAVQSLQPRLNAVYDVTLGYEGGGAGLADLILGRTRAIHIHLRRHPIESLPMEGEALANWLLARFAEKDALLESFQGLRHFKADSSQTSG
ncbi:MAG: lysophospholipid acyltransferase family protein [Oligoflexia bacterium]|nr:lysophospholipid acyltransferase family protein [Oligoflexia bacterium]